MTKLIKAGPGKAPTPSEMAVASGRKEVEGVDARGRRIVLRQPTIWEAFQLSKILGADAMNPAYAFDARMLQHVKVLGEDDDVFFRNEKEMKALVESLDYDGYETVQSLFIEHFMKAGKDAKDEIKNS